mgnify:CR=1 FL=1
MSVGNKGGIPSRDKHLRIYFHKHNFQLISQYISFKEFIVSYNKTCKEKASLVSKRIRMPLNLSYLLSRSI